MNKEELRFEVIKLLLNRRSDTPIEEICTITEKLEAVIFRQPDYRELPKDNQHTSQ
jgi:hypothetical protein